MAVPRPPNCSRKSSISSSSAKPAPDRSRFRWTGVLGILISLGLLWWALRGIELDELIGHVRQARVGYFLAAVLVATATFPLRTARWRYLLRLEGQSLRFLPLWHATAIGFMANNLLPARAGEFARAYTAGRLTGVQFSAALASLAVERIMDGIAMVALMTLAIVTGGFAGGVKVGGISLVGITGTAAILFALALATAVAVVHQPAMALGLARRVFARILPARFADRAIGFVEGLLAGLDALRSAPRFVAVIAWSLAVWCTYAASFWLCFRAFNIAVPWSAPLLLQGLIGFGVAVPSSPGFFGPFEAVTRATLALYGVDAGRAVSYAVAYHLGTFVPISLLGLWSLSRSHLHLADFKRGSPLPAPTAREAG
ncbi:MAG: flippase-like domain-containing protein [Gemmatimonadetes bacterium]|nr:flippase-like domain-containing protein [Gemmatimonadota bacterium]